MSLLEPSRVAIALVEDLAGRTQRWPRVVAPLLVALVALFVDAPAHAARALVYPVNPVRTPAVELKSLAIAPTGASLESPLLRVRSCADRGRTTLVPTVSPTPIRACTLEAAARPNDDGDYDAPPRSVPDARGEPDAFAEASAYHHVTRTLTFFEGLLGESLAGRPPLDVVVSGRLPDAFFGGDDRLAPRAGALYLPARDGAGAPFRAYLGTERDLIWVGATPSVDFAYDADVVVHETAHAVLDRGSRIHGYRRTIDGLSADPEALSEALADYFAAVVTGDPVIGEYALDGVAPASARDLEATPPELARLTGDPHRAGVVFAGALWSARRALSAADASRFDAAIAELARRPDTPSTVKMDELGALLVEELQASAVDTSSLEEALRERRILPTPRAIVDVRPDGALLSPAGAFLAPGTLAASAPSTRSALAPGLFQVRVAIPSGVKVLRGSARIFASRAGVWGAPPGTPMSLVALVAWDAPLDWDSAEPQGVRAPLDGEVFEVAIPDGAREAFVQLANAGEESGSYDALSLTFLDAMPSPASAVIEDSGGCALARRAPASSLHELAWLLGAVGVALVRRRRARAHERA